MIFTVQMVSSRIYRSSCDDIIFYFILFFLFLIRTSSYRSVTAYGLLAVKLNG